MHYESLGKGNKIHIKGSTAIELREYHIKTIKLTAGEAAKGIVFCLACLRMLRARWRRQKAPLWMQSLIRVFRKNQAGCARYECYLQTEVDTHTRSECAITQLAHVCMQAHSH